MIEIKTNFCQIHSSKQIKKQISTICYSFQCNYYRQLCNQCEQKDQQHKQHHISINNARLFVQKKLQQCQTTIDLTKTKKQQSSQKHLLLPIEIQQKLSSIRQTINYKIAEFQTKLKQQYTKQVNTKLDNVQESLKKAKQFFQKQLQKIKKSNISQFQLKKYFINFDYWNHQLKYYNDYIDQIQKKQVTKFKQSFDNDNLMRLNVNFEKNLNQIFIPNKQRFYSNSNTQNKKKLHLFCGQNLKYTKYSFTQRYQSLSIRAQTLPNNFKLTSTSDYQWKGSPQSIYCSQSNCYYIFGQGQKQSNVIVRYIDGKKNNQGQFTLFPSKMITKRSDFAVCLIFDEIYIIGGYNDNQGCLSSCQKVVLYKDNKKNYQISSLQQRSSCHSVCNYNNKYILKFGGISCKPTQNNSNLQIKQLYPEIYSLQKQSWKIIRYNNNQNQRLNFGIWPLITNEEKNSSKIIIFGNKPIQNLYYLNSSNKSQIKNVNQRKMFQIQCLFDRTQLIMKIVQKAYPMSRRYFIYPDIYFMNENNNKVKVFVKDLIQKKKFIQKIRNIQ